MDDNDKQVQKDLRLIFKSSVIMLIGVLLSKVLTYLYKIIVARSFGPEIYGLFSLSVAIVSLFVFISALGLDAGVLRFIPKLRSKKQSNKISFIFKTVITIQLIFSIILGFLLFLSAEYIAITFFHNSNLVIFLRFFSIVVPVNVLLTTFLGTIKAYEKIGWYSFIYNILQNILKVITLGLFILIGFKANSVILSYILSLFLALLFAYFVCRFIIKEVFKKSNIDKREKRILLKDVFSYSWPLMFFALTFSIMYWINSFVLGYFRSVTEVGFYEVGMSIAMLLSLSSSLFIQLFFPLVTKRYYEKKENLETIKQLSKQIGKWIFIINLPITVMLLLFPGVFINVLFGKEYLIAENVLRILAVAFLFDSITTISSNLLSMYGKTKTIFTDMGIAALMNLALSLFLIPKYGIVGAAISAAISFIILDILFLIQARHYLSIVPLRRKMIRIFLVSLIPAFIIVLLRNFLPEINIYLLIFLGTLYLLIYFFMLFVTFCLDKNDFMILRTIRRKIGSFRKLFGKKDVHDFQTMDKI